MNGGSLPADQQVYGLSVGTDWLERFYGTHAAQARPDRARAILAAAQGFALEEGGAVGARVPIAKGGDGTEVAISSPTAAAP